MNLPMRYAAFLSLLLIVMYVFTNPSFEDSEISTLNKIPNPIKMGSTLHTFSLAALFSIVLVIAALIGHIFWLNGPGFKWQTGFRSGEKAARWAAAFFALAVIIYALGFYSALLYKTKTGIPLVLFGGFTAFLGTYLLGLISAAITAIVVKRMRTKAMA